MCDCYAHKCECCEELIPMHIGDYEFPREDFRIWCEKHIDKAPTGAIVFEITESHELDDEPAGWKCAILGPEVVGSEDGWDNHPNLAAIVKCTEVT